MECSWKKIVTRPSDALWTWADAWCEHSNETNQTEDTEERLHPRDQLLSEFPSTFSQAQPLARPGPQLHPSPLQDVLQRAKERERERGLGKEGKNFFYLYKILLLFCLSITIGQWRRERGRKRGIGSSQYDICSWMERGERGWKWGWDEREVSLHVVTTSLWLIAKCESTIWKQFLTGLYQEESHFFLIFWDERVCCTLKTSDDVIQPFFGEPVFVLATCSKKAKINSILNPNLTYCMMLLLF